MRTPIVVYTAITARYDDLKPQPHARANDADFVAFLDEPAEAGTWRSRPAHTEFSDPARNAKIHKILPHVYFPDAEYSLWIDGSVTIRFPQPIRQLIEQYLGEGDLAVFQHRLRTCLYQEADYCIERRRDDPATIWRQICQYTAEGYPPNAGLAECTVLLRRHTPAMNAFNEAWWDEIAGGSKRDQVSFPYVARKTGLRYERFPGHILNNLLFHRDRHALPVGGFGGVWAPLDAPVIRGVPSARVGVRPDPADIPPSTATRPRAAADRPPARSARARQPRTVAFGPTRDLPSWRWIGFDVARELSRSYHVMIYDSWSGPPDGDVLLVIKERPPDRFVEEALRRGTRLVYCPVDTYRERGQIERDADFLRTCALVLVHSERLAPIVRRHCSNVHFVEHHARFALNQMADYRETGFVLWTGGCQYVPYLLRWLDEHPTRPEIRILTDLDNDRARRAARELAAEIGMRCELSSDTSSIAGHRIYTWSERRQEEMMRACKAALDVKLVDMFDQYYKPPTKAQQYVASGVPFAVNPESYSAEYFRVRGFELASPVETERWLSREYWAETRRWGEALRLQTSLEAVGARYRELIDSL